MAFRVPLGREATIAPFWIFSSTVSETSSTMKSSATLLTRPAMPPLT